MVSHDYDICNLALLKIGERQVIGGLSDGTEPAILCSVLYPQVRDDLLTRAPWRFATRQSTLVEQSVGIITFAWAIGFTYGAGSVITYNGAYFTSRVANNLGHAPVGDSSDQFWMAGRVTDIPGWAYGFRLPDDYLQAQYVFSGVRPGQPGVPLMSTDALSVSQVDLLPAINGQAVQVPFEVSGALLFCDLPSVQLVYTSQIMSFEDLPANVPPTFVDALVWELAVQLALASPKKADLAQRLEAKARQAYAEARAAEGNAEQGELRSDSRFISRRA